MGENETLLSTTEILNEQISNLIIGAERLLKEERQAPSYFGDLDIIAELKKAQNFPWNNDYLMTGIQHAGCGFALKDPILRDFNIQPWNDYLQESMEKNNILILGGGAATKEAGLINQFAVEGGRKSQANLLITDKPGAKLKVHKKQWKNIQQKRKAKLDLTNFDMVTKTIRDFSPDIITMYSVIAVFQNEIQKKVLETVVKSLKIGAKVLFGVALPGSELNMYGKSMKFKSDIVSKTCIDLLAATLFNEGEKKRYSFLFEAKERLISEKAKQDYKEVVGFNPAWFLHITAHLDRLKQNGLRIQSLSTQEAVGSVGLGRPASFPAYLTAYCVKE